MGLEVYADESGTHDDTGNEVNSEVAVIGGYIASHEEWANFSEIWQFTLNAYKVPFFHFRDFDARRRNPKDASNPYHHLNDEQLEDMLYDLAIVAGMNQVPVGGMYHVKKHFEEKHDGDSTIKLWQAFFNGFWEQMHFQWPGFNEPVNFIFDQNENPRWQTALSQVFVEAQNKDPRLISYTFADDEKILPLQAADLYAYVTRQAGVPYMESGKQNQPARILDIALNKNRLLKEGKKAQWLIAMYAIIEDMRSQRRQAKQSGSTPKKYYPLSDHPFFKDKK